MHERGYPGSLYTERKCSKPHLFAKLTLPSALLLHWAGTRSMGEKFLGSHPVLLSWFVACGISSCQSAVEEGVATGLCGGSTPGIAVPGSGPVHAV